MKTYRVLSLVACNVLFVTIAFGQSATVSLGAGSGAPGSSLSLPISLNATSGAQVSAVEWTITYSATDFAGVSVAQAGTAASAGKTVDCSNSPGQTTCVLYGVSDALIANGTIATATFAISSGTRNTSSAVNVTNGSTASPTGSAITTTTTGATIKILTSTPVLNGLSCNPSSLTGPGTSNCVASISASAPAGGLIVSLGYTAPSGVVSSFPPTVTIASGTTSAQFAIGVNKVSSTASISVAATLNGVSVHAVINDTASTAVAVTLNPSSAVLTAGQTQQFSWTVSGTSNTSVKWSVSPGIGTIQNSGLYTAPASVTGEQLVTITVSSVADPTKSASATVDLVSPPVISSVKSSVSGTTATITWSTNLGSDSSVSYGTSASSLSHNVSDTTFVTAHSLALTSLASNTTYYFRVTSKNKAGQASTFPILANPALSFRSGGGSAVSPSADVTVSFDQNNAAKTVTSPAFSTSKGNELLLAFISSDYVGGPNTSVTSVSGAGLNWVLVQRTNAEFGTAEIWRAFANSPLTGASVTATLSQSVVSSLTVMTFSGVNISGSDGSGAIGAVGTGFYSAGAPAANLTTTQSNSLVIGVGNDFDNAIPRTPSTGQILVHQDLSSTSDTYWVQQLSGPVAAANTRVVMYDSAPTGDRYNLSICEILAGAVSGASSAGLNSPGAAQGVR